MCSRIEGLPRLPVRSADNLWCFSDEPSGCVPANVSTPDLIDRIARARGLARAALRKQAEWKLAEVQLAAPAEIESKYAGIMVVGDSQARELAWGALKAIRRRAPLRWATGSADPLGELGSDCLPVNAGKLGFVASCSPRAPTARAASCSPRAPTAHAVSCSQQVSVKHAASCSVHAPYMPAARHLLKRGQRDRVYAPLYNLSGWDHRLTVLPPAPHARRAPDEPFMCDPHGFFIGYQPVWGSAPIEPSSLPRCFHHPNGRFGLTSSNGTTFRPVLWLINGGGMHHAMHRRPADVFGPHVALRRFSPAAQQDVVWMPVGAGPAPQFDSVMHLAAAEAAWLADNPRVRHFDFTTLARLYLALMSDEKHFTYYYAECSQVFPQMTFVVAQIAIQAALGREVVLCSPLHTVQTDTQRSRLDGRR